MGKSFNIADPPEDPEGFREWVIETFREIRDMHEEGDVFDVADEFSISNHTETISLNVSTATTADVANFVATLMDALKRRGLRGES